MAGPQPLLVQGFPLHSNLFYHLCFILPPHPPLVGQDFIIFKGTIITNVTHVTIINLLFSNFVRNFFNCTASSINNLTWVLCFLADDPNGQPGFLIFAVFCGTGKRIGNSYNKNQWGVLTLTPTSSPAAALANPDLHHYHITLYPYPFPPLDLGSFFCLYSGFEKLKSDTTLSLRITVTNTKLVNGTELPSLPQTTQVKLADTYLCFCASNFSW